MRTLAAVAVMSLSAGVGLAADLPIVDAHIHYSHDAWEVVPPKEAVGAPAQGAA